MNARADCHRPDDEDLAYDLCKEDQFDSLRRDYVEVTAALRDYRKYTDQQLRGLKKEKESLRRKLWREYQYDVTDDIYDVHLNSETSTTMPREELSRDEPSSPSQPEGQAETKEIPSQGNEIFERI
jgi:hypothetical protein